MRNWKRIAALLMAGMMAVGTMAGCGAASQGTQSGETASAQQEAEQPTGEQAGDEAAQPVSGKVEFWNDKLGGTEQGELNKIKDNIAAMSGIELEFVQYPDTAAYQTAMQQSIKGETAPGLFTWWSGPQLETLAKNGLLEDMTDMWDEYVIPNGVSADIAESLTVDGKIYAVPYSILYNTMLYNKKVFDQYGLAVPTTFDEFLEVCQTLLDNGVTPIALKNDSWAGFIWFQAMLASSDPQLYLDVCDGTTAYTDEKVKSVMTQWKEMLDKGYFTAPMTIQDMDKSLAQGTVAMELEPNGEAGTLVKEYGLVPGEDFGSFVLPSMSGKKKAVFYEISPLCVAKESKDKEAAKEVLKYWFTKENQTILTEVTNNVNTSEVQTDNAVINEMISYSTDAENYQMLLRYYENTPEEIRNVALDELMKFQLGNAGVDEVLTAIQTKADEVFGK